MKKRLLSILGVLFIMSILVSCSQTNKSSMTGRYLKTSDGTNHIIINDTIGPIVMSNKTNKENIFDNLQSGDKIEITHDEVRESYPGGTNIYSCKFIERGTKEDIPQDTLKTLQDMGWAFDFSQLDN